jgi:hypothetical protein
VYEQSTVWSLPGWMRRGLHGVVGLDNDDMSIVGPFAIHL